nr:ACT domain-containing protein ACR4 isoform X2 [Tanacetum cinerariifolium]
MWMKKAPSARPLNKKFGENYCKAVMILSVVVALIGPILFKWPFFSTPGILPLLIGTNTTALPQFGLFFATRAGPEKKNLLSIFELRSYDRLLIRLFFKSIADSSAEWFASCLPELFTSFFDLENQFLPRIAFEKAICLLKGDFLAYLSISYRKKEEESNDFPNSAFEKAICLSKGDFPAYLTICYRKKEEESNDFPNSIICNVLEGRNKAREAKMVGDPVKDHECWHQRMHCNVLEGRNKAREAKTVVANGGTHTKHRLHQMILEDHEFERNSCSVWCFMGT